MSDPTAGMAPIQAAGEQQINAGYAGSGDIISRMMASRGYGSSGDMGNTMYATDLSRLGSLSQFKGTMAQTESTRQMQAAGDMNQLIQTNTGKNVSTPGAGLANGFIAASNGIGNINNSLMTLMLSGAMGD